MNNDVKNMKYVVIFYCKLEHTFGISKTHFDSYDSANEFIAINIGYDIAANCAGDFIYKIVEFPEIINFLIEV